MRDDLGAITAVGSYTATGCDGRGGCNDEHTASSCSPRVAYINPMFVRILELSAILCTKSSDLMAATSISLC